MTNNFTFRTLISLCLLNFYTPNILLAGGVSDGGGGTTVNSEVTP